MPIRINLLAEAKALEESRRRDPVKRALWVGGFLVVLTLFWSASLQLKAMMAKSQLSRVEAQLAARTNEFQQVLENQRKLTEVNFKLSSLTQLATNRLLYGTLLNALQQTAVDDVRLMRLRVDQSYTLNPEVKPKTNSNDRITPGKPASVTEKIVLTLDARDNSPNPGDEVNKYKHAISQSPYFQSLLGKTNEMRLASLSPPQTGENKAFVSFTLECRYPEMTR